MVQFLNLTCARAPAPAINGVPKHDERFGTRWTSLLLIPTESVSNPSVYEHATGHVANALGEDLRSY